jgi:hypothetical protein
MVLLKSRSHVVVRGSNDNVKEEIIVDVDEERVMLLMSIVNIKSLNL